MTLILSRPRRCHLLTASGVLALGLVLAGCGGNHASTGGHGAAAPSMKAGHPSATGLSSSVAPLTGAALDKAFLAGMVPHHQAAVDMAKVEVAKGKMAQAKALAQKVIDSQDKEIATMTRIASSSFGFTPTRTPHTGPMGELMGVPLSMDLAMMATQVSQAAAPDLMFLSMMIPHHASAIVMADEERMNGGNAELKALAGTIIAEQAKEIGEMQLMLPKA